MGTCPSCKSPIEKGQWFCPNCGKAIQEASFADSIDADTGTAEPTPAFPSATEDKTAVCPVCKAAFEPSARYCEKDGALLERVESYVLPDFGPKEAGRTTGLPVYRGTPSKVLAGEVATAGQAPEDPGIKKSGFKAGKWVVVLVFILAGVLAAYFYRTGLPGSTVGVEEYLNNVLKTRGFDITAKMEEGGRAVVSGKVKSEDDRKAAIAIIRSDNKVKSVTDNIMVVLSPADLEQSLNRALQDAGLGEVQARVGQDFIVALSGTTQDQQEKDAALGMLRKRQGIKGLNDAIQIKKPSIQGKAGEATADFTQTAHFKVLPLSPSTWASKKYTSSATFGVPGPGRILMEADWQQQGTLALILNNAESHDTYAQKDGTSPLKLVHRITAQNLAKGSLWEVAVANFTSTGPVEGSLKITFLSGEANRPFASIQEPPFDANRLEREINDALKAAGIKGVTAEVGKDRTVTLTGSVKTIEEKQKAIGTAKQFKAIKEVKDIIFVVG
jgi:osmotically-inducible protein OsmY